MKIYVVEAAHVAILNESLFISGRDVQTNYLHWFFFMAEQMKNSKIYRASNIFIILSRIKRSTIIVIRNWLETWDGNGRILAASNTSVLGGCVARLRHGSSSASISCRFELRMFRATVMTWYNANRFSLYIVYTLYICCIAVCTVRIIQWTLVRDVGRNLDFIEHKLLCSRPLQCA